MNQNSSPGKEETFRRFRENAEKLEIDEKVQDTVAYLNALGFNTAESCEGHLDHGSIAPRIAVNAPEKPTWRFAGQEEVFKKIAEKHGVTIEEIFEYVKPKYGIPEESRTRPENEEQITEAWNDGWDLTSREEETEEFKLWREKTDKLAGQLDALAQEFYKERSIADENTRLVIEKHDDSESPHVYNFFLHNGGKDYLTMVNPEEREKLSEEEMNVLRKRLESNQQEMKDFTEFLKQKFTTSE